MDIEGRLINVDTRSPLKDSVLRALEPDKKMMLLKVRVTSKKCSHGGCRVRLVSPVQTALHCTDMGSSVALFVILTSIVD